MLFALVVGVFGDEGASASEADGEWAPPFLGDECVSPTAVFAAASVSAFASVASLLKAAPCKVYASPHIAIKIARSSSCSAATDKAAAPPGMRAWAAEAFAAPVAVPGRLLLLLLPELLLLGRLVLPRESCCGFKFSARARAATLSRQALASPRGNKVRVLAFSESRATTDKTQSAVDQRSLAPESMAWASCGDAPFFRAAATAEVEIGRAHV